MVNQSDPMNDNDAPIPNKVTLETFPAEHSHYADLVNHQLAAEIGLLPTKGKM